MEIIIHLLSKKIDSEYMKAIDEYIKRCSSFCKLKLKAYKKYTTPDIQSKSKYFIVTTAKDTISSTEFADLISNTCVSGFSRIEFIVPEGLNLDSLSKDDNYIGFSSFSIENELTAVALTEQIYRAFTILNNITYHK